MHPACSPAQTQRAQMFSFLSCEGEALQSNKKKKKKKKKSLLIKAQHGRSVNSTAVKERRKRKEKEKEKEKEKRC